MKNYRDTMQQNAKANVPKQQINQAVCRKKMAVLAECLLVKLLSVNVHVPCKRHPDLMLNIMQVKSHISDSIL